MPPSTRFSERVTTLLSTLVAAGLLAAGVTAQQSRTNRPVSLERLESDLRFQIRSAFRMTPRESEQRLRQLDNVLEDFRSRPLSDADRQILGAWLLKATVRSMPGSIKPLPTAPVYSERDQAKFSVSAKPSKRKSVAQKSTLSDTSRSQSEVASPARIEAPSRFEALTDPEQSTEPRVRLAASKPVVTEFAQKGKQENADSLRLSVDSEQETTLASSQPERSILTANLAPSTPSPIDINMSELMARIAGYHAGLDDLEAAAVNAKRPDEKLLSRQIELLEGLISVYQFVQLYYDSLNPQERRRVAAPRKLNGAISATRERLGHLQEEVEADFLGQYDRQLGHQLKALSQRLERIASQVSW